MSCTRREKKTEHLVVCTERDTDAHFLSCLAHVTDHLTHMRLAHVDCFVPRATQKSLVHLMFHGTLFESQFSSPSPFSTSSFHTFSDLHTKSDEHTVFAVSFNESERNSARRHDVCSLGRTKPSYRNFIKSCDFVLRRFSSAVRNQ